jgi:hypothetical protein
MPQCMAQDTIQATLHALGLPATAVQGAARSCSYLVRCSP